MLKINEIKMLNKARSFLLLICLILSTPIAAQNETAEEDNTFGGWEFFEVYHSFKNSNWYALFYFEHANFQYQRLDSCYGRTMIGYKVNNWLKAGVAYDFMQEPDYITHRAVGDLIGTLKQGNLTVSIRERYIYSWSPKIGEYGNVIRSRLKAQYTIPESHFKPYLAIEVFTWDKWKKTRHYVGTTFTINEHFEIEGYYIYYTFNGKPAQHVLGIGLNIEL